MKIKQLYEFENGAELEMAPVTIPEAVVNPDTQENLADALGRIEGSVPTKVSELENDKGYLTSHQDISGKLDSSVAAATYATKDEVSEGLEDKVDKVEGKQLTTEDFTTALKTKLEGLYNYDDTEVAQAVETLENSVANINDKNEKQDLRLDSLESNALVSTYTLEQSSNPAFEISNTNAAKLYISQMGGYLFYNGNADGKVYASKLNPYDWGKFADGTPVTEAIEAATETMVHVPECHFKASGKTMNFGGIIPIDGGHTFGSPHWVGAYLGSIADGALHSRPNVAPSHSQTMSAFWNYAQATHANKEYGLANYQFHCLINALFQARYGNLNSQEVIGAGWQSSSWEAARDVPMGVTKSLGDGSGKVYYNDSTLGDQYPVKICGFEDLYGKLWQFRPNIRFEMRDGVRYAIVYDGNQVSNTATGREFVTALQSVISEYVKSMKLGEYWDMIAESVGGSDTTYYCDGGWAATTGALLHVGGSAGNGSRCGLSCASSDDGFSDSTSHLGARLAFWSEPVIIGGAELVAMIG